MNLSPLGPTKKTYLGLAALCLLGAGVIQSQWVAPGRIAALGPPRASTSVKAQMVELWPVLLGGFRGPIVAGLAYYASEREQEADVYGTLSSIRTLIEVQPEFEHLWIYYAWVLSYNMPAVINSPEDRYSFILDGADFLKTGIGRIAQLYHTQRPCVNDRDPMRNQPIDIAQLTPETRRTFQDETVGFADPGGAMAWDRLDTDAKQLQLEFVRAGSLEYKRKRATLLYMLGWTCYQKLSHGEEPKTWYRQWYIRDRGQDPFQVAVHYLRMASAVDVPPYQVSYEVIKTSPANCLMDRARALSEDPKVPTKIVSEAFQLALAERKRSLAFVEEPKRFGPAVREVELTASAMRFLAFAEERAEAGNAGNAQTALIAAENDLKKFMQEQPDATYPAVYVQRLEFARERVRKWIAGERP